MAGPPFSPAASKPGTSDFICASASDGGRLVAVAATSSPGTLIHTVPTSIKDRFQRISLWACNIDTSERTLTIQFGGTSTSDTMITKLGAQRGFVLIVPDFKLFLGLSVRAFADSANKINVYAGVGEISKEP